MQKWILIFFLQLLIFGRVSAQDQVSCNQILEDAKEAYSAGMVDVVPVLLKDCLNSGLKGSSKQEAYILVITSYLFDYLPEQADTVMERFLDDYPSYLSRTTDPEEFTMLLNSHKQEREVARREADRQEQIAEQARREEQTRQDAIRLQELKDQQKLQRTQKRQPGGKTGPGIGPMGGVNLSLPQILEVYSISNPNESDGAFALFTPGWTFGVTGVIPISDNIETSVSLVYQQARMSYSATPFSFTSYTYSERQNRLAIPVSFNFQLNPGSDTKFYLKAGGVADYLTKAVASAERKYSSAGDARPDVVVQETDILTSRSGMNVYALAGAGVRFPMGTGFIFTEASYQFGFLKDNNSSNRYDNQNFIWQIYHVDPDFRLHQVNVTAGIVFYLR